MKVNSLHYNIKTNLYIQQMQNFPPESLLSNQKKYHEKMESLYFSMNNLINRFLTNLSLAITTHGFESNAIRYHSFIMKTFMPLELQCYINFQCEDTAFKSMAMCSMEPFAYETKRKQKQFARITGYSDNRATGNYRHLADDTIQSQSGENQKMNQRGKSVFNLQVQMKLRQWILDQIRNKRKVKQMDITRQAMLFAKTDNTHETLRWCKRFLYKYSQIKELLIKKNNQLKNQELAQNDKYSEVNRKEDDIKDNNQQSKNLQAEQRVYPNEIKSRRKADIVAKFLSDSYNGMKKYSPQDDQGPREFRGQGKKKKEQQQLKEVYQRLQQKVNRKLYGYPQ